jgi:serine/threonine-protein kinase
VPDPLIGRTIGGRYVVTERVGSGGMGTVYRAKQEVVGRDVAIKFLAADLAVDPVNRERFLREARAANRINHEHIIDITDFGDTDDGLVYLVMEFLEGVPLNEEIANGPMPPARALNIALQIAQALARAHELDVVHRDIKPENVYLLRGYDGDFVKILDFGLAHMKGQMKLTATGTVFGTPEYMAPEQARGAPSTYAVDLYGLGCVLYELLTGDIPFTGSTPDLILKHMREKPEAPSKRKSGLPPSIDALVLKLLEKSPEARHPDAYALADELKAILAELGAPRQSRGPKTVGQISILPGEMMRTATYGTPDLPEKTEKHDTRVETMASQTIVTEDVWEERIQLLAQLVPEAHPRGDSPSWLSPKLAELRERVAKMKALRHELDQLRSNASRQESEAREVRLRIGRALDELGHDESRVSRLLAEIRPKFEEAKARLEELEKPLLRAWAAIPPMPVDRPRATPEIVETLREAGHLAAIWIEAERAYTARQRDLAEREREREDLKFQVAQLKGRLGTLNAESDLDMGDVRNEATRLDSELRTLIDYLMREITPVYNHFMGIPSVRDRVFNVA